MTLTLGPLDLNLLGLRVQLNQVVLEIAAEQGPGNLLGNLLSRSLVYSIHPVAGLVLASRAFSSRSSHCCEILGQLG